MIRDEEILAAIRESGITPEQLKGMLTKNAILVTVEEKRAELARAKFERDEFMRSFNEDFSAQVAPYNAKVEALEAELAQLEAQAAQSL